MHKPTERLFFALGIDHALADPTCAQDSDKQTPFHRLCHFNQTLNQQYPSTESSNGLTLELGHCVPEANLHVTLAFLGAITPQQKTVLIAQASRITMPAFSLNFDHLGYWPSSRVLWLGTHQPPQQLLTLAQQLQQMAKSVGVYQLERTYIPHITLRKQVPPSSTVTQARPLDQRGFSFHFQHFGLYISEQLQAKQPRPDQQGSNHPPQVQYRCLHQWPLQIKKTKQDA
ncbi:RNA 2',3'-cyclic phosphodiesterase [Photobacterium kagoshimensis]|uniref:RNA 2',3'-cyclic phosphodiesterase n=1 Tax=Photobacterium kagoshimensis TaxID=2910242 RepID=UPI003D11D79E